jgi:hypothetical protein
MSKEEVSGSKPMISKLAVSVVLLQRQPVLLIRWHTLLRLLGSVVEGALLKHCENSTEGGSCPAVVLRLVVLSHTRQLSE